MAKCLKDYLAEVIGCLTDDRERTLTAIASLAEIANGGYTKWERDGAIDDLARQLYDAWQSDAVLAELPIRELVAHAD